MNQAEDERDGPAGNFQNGKQVVERGNDDRKCDCRFYPLAWKRHIIHHGQPERNRVSDREHGYDFQHRKEGWFEFLNGQPFFLLSNQNSRQEKRNQKQDMVEPDPDVPDAFFRVVNKR